MNIVEPIFGRTAANTARSCGCTCTQTIPGAPSFDSLWAGTRDKGGGCTCSCNTSIQFNDSINFNGAYNYR